MPNDPNTGWYVGIIAALALLAVGYMVFAASSVPVGVKQWPWPDAPPFITSNSKTTGEKFITVKVRDFPALHLAHDIVLDAFKAALTPGYVLVPSRAEVIEECAKVAEAYETIARSVPRNIAANIRAMIAKMKPHFVEEK